MKRRTKGTTAGFTMAELLIVVAIVGILVAIAIPLFTSQLEAAKEATCEANRRSVKAALLAEYIPSQQFDAQTSLATALKAVGSTETAGGGTSLCPDGGVYSCEGTPETGIVVTCSKHAEQETSGGGGTNESRSQAFMQAWQDFLASGTVTGWQATNNDKLRDAFFAAYGKDNLPTLTVGDTSLIVQPYYSSSGDSWLFAKADTSNSSWSVKYVCDPTTGKWYQAYNQWNKPTSVSVNGFASANDLHQALTAENTGTGNYWVELTDYTIAAN